jgi:hypothetical protein
MDKQRHNIYLVQKEEHLKNNTPVFKIGLTTNPYIRFQKYKNCRIILFMEVTDCYKFETKLLNKFKLQFKQEKDFGREYFSGDCDLMKEIIIDMITGSLITKKNEFINPLPINTKKIFLNKCKYIKTRGPDKGNSCLTPCEFDYCSKCLNLKSVKALIHQKQNNFPDSQEYKMEIEDKYLL